MKLSRAVYALLFSAFFLISVAGVNAQSGRFSLGLYQGVRLSDNKIVESKDPAADITVSPRYKGYVVYAALQAKKLKEFETKPNLTSLTAADIDRFSELAFGPAPGNYYFIKSNDNRYYLCKLESFENQGKAASYWKLTFSYEEIHLRGQVPLSTDDGISHGKKTYPDGSTYEGDLLNGKPQGKGILQSLEGYYEGDFVNGKPQGKGSIRLPDGTSYEGEFTGSAFHGKGNLKLPDGSSYEGSFVNGAFQGRGILRFSEGGYYEGEFTNGKCNGEGTMYDANGQVLKKGQWSNNQFIDTARTDANPPLAPKSPTTTTNDGISHDKKIYTDGSSYEGDFVNGKRHGKGIYRWPSGASYEGDFVNGSFKGKGVYKWPSGASYEGDYVNDKRTGKGIYKWPDGRRYEGEFVDGKFQGKGILYAADGKLFQKGQWANDQLIASDQLNTNPPAPSGQKGSNEVNTTPPAPSIQIGAGSNSLYFFSSAFGNFGSFVRLDLKNTAIKPLGFKGDYLTVSPDSKYLVYLGNSSTYHVYDLETGTDKEFPKERADYSAPLFISKHLFAFLKYQTNTYFFIKSVLDGTERQLPHRIPEKVSISSDIAFVPPFGGDLPFVTTAGNCLYLISEKATTLLYRSDSPADNLRYPAVSPDGKKVVFVSDLRKGMWVINIDGSGLKQLTDRDCQYSAWSPDGKYIAFTSADSGNRSTGSFTHRIWVLGSDGSNPQPLQGTDDEGISIIGRLVWR